MDTRTLLVLPLLAGLAAPAGAAPLRSQQGPYELQVLCEGVPLRTYDHAGETYVLGHHGDRYTLRVWNHSGRRVEVVATVDGRDVIDGRPGDYVRKRGYVVPAYGYVDIEGWRLSAGQVAAFRFSSVDRSYAARTGSAREVGVIGVAVFPERLPSRPLYLPRPWSSRSETAPARDGSASDVRAQAPSPKNAAPSPPPASEPGRDAKTEGALSRLERFRPGLGTAFGEAMDSAAYQVEFHRQHPSRPEAILGVRYNDREGLLAMGVPLDGPGEPDEAWMRRTADPFPFVSRRYATPPPGWEYR
ncbi:MAG: hypothetical protein RMK29_11435 [Myxococcales bacterium]|nr:hypothetical protein [Myxococcota bacterium]MDW8282320.1 hypothetical protein [Myxococcales bacterium]